MALPYRISSSLITQSEVSTPAALAIEDLPEYTTYQDLQKQLDETKAYVEKLSMQSSLSPKDVVDIETNHPGVLANQTNFALESFSDSSTKTLNIALEAFTLKMGAIIAALITAVIALIWKVISWLKKWWNNDDAKKDKDVDKTNSETRVPVSCPPELFSTDLFSDAETLFIEAGFSGAKVKELASCIRDKNGYIEYISLIGLINVSQLGAVANGIMVESRYTQSANAVSTILNSGDLKRWVNELNNALNAHKKESGKVQDTFQQIFKYYSGHFEKVTNQPMTQYEANKFIKIMDKEPIIVHANEVCSKTFNLYKAVLPANTTQRDDFNTQFESMKSEVSRMFSVTESTLAVDGGYLNKNALNTLEQTDQMFCIVNTNARRDIKAALNGLVVTAKEMKTIRDDIKKNLEETNKNFHNWVEKASTNADKKGVIHGQDSFATTEGGRQIIATYNEKIKEMVNNVSSFVNLVTKINNHTLNYRNKKEKIQNLRTRLSVLSEKGNKNGN